MNTLEGFINSSRQEALALIASIREYIERQDGVLSGAAPEVLEQLDNLEGALSTHYDSFFEENRKLVGKLDGVDEQISGLTKELEEYSELGTLEELRRAVYAHEQNPRIVEEVEQEINDMREALDRTIKELKGYRELGSLGEIKLKVEDVHLKQKAIRLIEGFGKTHSHFMSDLQKTLNSIDAVDSSLYGAVTKELEAYRRLGYTPRELKKILDKSSEEE